MARTPLPAEQAAARVAEISGWVIEDGKLARTFTFDDFARAMGFMVAVAIKADKLDHHPNWSNVYHRVEVTLWTHDAGGLTELDFELAAHMNACAAARD